MQQLSKASRIAIAYKILLGIVECVFGVGLLLLEVQLLTIYERYAYKEIIEDPHDLLFTITNKYLPTIITHRYLIALFFLLIGVIKILGGFGMLYGKDWGKHVLIGFLVAFLPYEAVALIRDPSLIDAGLFLLNGLVTLYFMHFRPIQYAKEVKALVSRRPSDAVYEP